jgi:4-hydroxy-tetrahydrodipicolinate synthase
MERDKTMKPLSGVLPVFQTPFNDDETIDFATLEREFDWLFENGADGVVMAMASETLRLSSEERERLAEATCRLGRDRGIVVISVGAEASTLAERFARHAEAHGADAVMAIPPVSVALGDDEIVRYYERIIRAVRIPLVVQDASGYVGRPMSIELQARLLKDYGPERVQFKPEAVPIGPRLTALREATGGKARVFEGSGGGALVESFRRGISGTMPGADLIDAIVALWRALKDRDEERIYRISFPLTSLLSLLYGLDGYLVVEKYLLKKRGIFKNSLVRGPVGFHLDEQTREEIDRRFELILKALQEAS